MNNLPSPRRRAYGGEPSQFGVLRLPAGPPPFRVVVLIHGGYWSLPWGADLLARAARDLAGRGLAVWNLEYRRLGEAGGGWPGTFDDVLAGSDFLARLPEAKMLNLSGVAVAGHSAGGHLALWLAAERGPSAGASVGDLGDRGEPAERVPAGGNLVDRGEPAEPGPFARTPVRVVAVAALAAVTDLKLAWQLGAGGTAVEALMGGPPGRYPKRYAAASPAERLPIGVPQLLLTGERDRMVPAELSVRYAAAAGQAGDPVELAVLRRTGHMDVVDPGKKAWAQAAQWITSITAGAV